MSLLVAVLLIGAAAVPSFALGTNADTGQISNGFFTAGDTVPKSFGRVSVSYWTTTTLADSVFRGPGSSDSQSVDTGFDLAVIASPADTNLNAGDTGKFVYGILNQSNATIRIDVDSLVIALGDSFTNWSAGVAGAGAHVIYWDRLNDSLYSSGGTVDTWLSSPDSSLRLAPGQLQQVIVTIKIPTTANDGESSHLGIQITNNAFLVVGTTPAGSNGDSWEAGVPVYTGSGVGNDTQWDTVSVTCVGPNILVAKDVYELTSGRSRPGDTLVCMITFDNDGGDTAKGVQIYDAIPQFTRYVKNTADSGNVCFDTYTSCVSGNNNQTLVNFGDSDIAVAFDTDAAGEDATFDDTEAFQADTIATPISALKRPVSVIRWTLKGRLGAQSSSDADVNTSASFIGSTASGNLDCGRVEYRVVIE